MIGVKKSPLQGVLIFNGSRLVVVVILLMMMMMVMKRRERNRLIHNEQTIVNDIQKHTHTQTFTFNREANLVLFGRASFKYNQTKSNWYEWIKVELCMTFTLFMKAVKMVQNDDQKAFNV